jgi:hypothetical protein
MPTGPRVTCILDNEENISGLAAFNYTPHFFVELPLRVAGRDLPFVDLVMADSVEKLAQLVDLCFNVHIVVLPGNENCFDSVVRKFWRFRVVQLASRAFCRSFVKSRMSG